MFTIAIIIGLYGYSIFFLGLLKLIYAINIYILTIIFFILGSGILWFEHSREPKHNTLLNFTHRIKDLRWFHLLLLLLIISAFINFVGVLGPELAFDALWYHLTLPKLYLQSHSISYIPGGLYYYSVMPQLTEMLYTAALGIRNEILAKCIHFLFGILTCIALYKTSRKFLNRTFSLLTILVFYSNLVVAWESITSYRDLTTTFYQLMAVWGLLHYFEKKQNKWLILSGCMLGFAISTNLLAITSIPVYLLVVLLQRFYSSSKRSMSRRSIVLDLARTIMVFLFLTVLIPVPWFIYSYIHTGNPIYPFFTGLYPVPLNLNFHPVLFTKEVIKLLLFAPDPLNPIYLICLPLLISAFKQLNSTLKILSIYSFLALLIWYVLPRTGGGRYILPYLPIFSLVTVAAIHQLKYHKAKIYLFTLIILIAVINLTYRSLANAKYIPVILGKESKTNSLCRNLDFSFGDFYDCDGKLSQIIKPNDKVLIFGGHNFYYANFNFVHSSYTYKNNNYDYVLTQNSELPMEYRNFKIIYENKFTKVRLYKLR